MNLRMKGAVFPALVVVSCGCCALLWARYTAREKALQVFRQEVSPLREVSAQNQALLKIRAELDELERLRRNHFELGELVGKITALRQAQAERKRAVEQSGAEEMQRLQLENAKLRNELEALKAMPAAVEDRRAVDGSELEQIGHFFRAYARNNHGKYPADFSELKYYLPAAVYPGIETNRFEILASEIAANAEPGQQALVRSRFKDNQNIRLYLFADGHLETREAP